MSNASSARCPGHQTRLSMIQMHNVDARLKSHQGQSRLSLLGANPALVLLQINAVKLTVNFAPCPGLSIHHTHSLRARIPTACADAIERKKKNLNQTMNMVRLVTT